MQEGAKKRLAGTVVMVALAVIFVPMLFEDESLAPPYVPGPLPPEPDLQDSSAFDTPYAPSDAPPAPANPGTLSDAEMQLAPPAPMQPFERVDGAFFEEGADETAAFEPIQEPASPAAAAPRPTPPPAASRAPAPTPKPAQSPKSAQSPAPPPRPEPSVSLPEPPKSRADGLPSWVVQVSSLGSPDAAGKLADKLKQAGFSAFVEQATVNGKTYYRVRVGPDINRANAERTAEMLRRQQKLDTLIQRYQ